MEEVIRKIKRDEEVIHYLEKANINSINRYKYNDHGKVHAEIVMKNAIKIAEILKKKGIKFSLEKEGFSFEDVKVVLALSSFLHDIGMAINRKNHELFSVILAKPIVERILKEFYNKEEAIKLEGDVLQAIVCHMGNYKANFIEGKIVAIADGTDMEEGRARIPFKLYEASSSTIHTFSALAIKKVEISEGKEKPVRISISMENPAGVFQVEEILLKKIESQDASDLVEVYCYVNGKEFRKL